MKFTSITLVYAVALIFVSFTRGENSIPACYTSFKAAEGLKMQAPAQLTGTEKTIPLETAAGNVGIAVTNGYNVVYINKNKAAVVALKVIQANAATFAKDTAEVLASLRYLNSRDNNTESKGLITLSYNGYKIYGISHNKTTEKVPQGSFIMFPGNHIIVSINFNDITGSKQSQEDYQGRRNTFLGAYTAHLQNCR